jgi:hypothetical protein
VRAIVLDEEEEEGDDHDDADYAQVEEEEEEEEQTKDERMNKRAKNESRKRKEKEEANPEEEETSGAGHTPHTLGEGDVVTRGTVKALAFKRGVERTKEERVERLKDLLSRPALELIQHPDSSVPAAAAPKPGKGGKAGQVLFRERHRHWIAEAIQKDAQGRSRDDPAYDPSTLYIPRKVGVSRIARPVPRPLH